MLDQFLRNLERKFRGRAIPNLMTWIIMGMGLVFVLDNLTILPLRHRLSYDLAFNWAAICRGEIWRLITFIFLPTQRSMLFILFSMYMYWMIGSTLEAQWGTFRFNVYYLFGILGTIISGIITGGTVTNHYINLSMFLAFALINPNFEILLFFFLPIKMKWLAALDGLLLAYNGISSLVSGHISDVVALAFSLLNLGLFFGPAAIDNIKDMKRRRDWRNNWR